MRRMAITVLVLAGCGSGIHGSIVDAGADTAVDTAVDAHPDAEIVHTGKTVFITSLVYQGGSLGGLDGADTQCGMRATSGGLTGTFRAWLSDATDSASTRLTHSTGEYRLIDGTLVAASWDDLVHSNLSHPIDIDENGATYVLPVDGHDCMTKTVAWTSTDVDGTDYMFNNVDYSCGGWTSTQGNGLTGNTAKADGQWTNSGCAVGCANKVSLYCIEQ